MSKAERAIQALEECADAVEALPDRLRRNNFWLGVPLVSGSTLREEATWLRQLVDALKEGMEE